MVEVTCTAKKWGSSVGIVIPKTVVENQHISEGEKLLVDIKKKHIAKEFFGILSGWKKSPQQLKDEAREGWE